jgi:hypothetical protein
MRTDISLNIKVKNRWDISRWSFGNDSKVSGKLKFNIFLVFYIVYIFHDTFVGFIRIYEF